MEREGKLFKKYSLFDSDIYIIYGVLSEISA